MQHTKEFLETASGPQRSAFAELDAIRVAVAHMRDELLDFNPLLAVMAESLQRALELELEARRCNSLHGDPV